LLLDAHDVSDLTADATALRGLVLTLVPIASFMALVAGSSHTFFREQRRQLTPPGGSHTLPSSISRPHRSIALVLM